jgi:hypothetical protein
MNSPAPQIFPGNTGDETKTTAEPAHGHTKQPLLKIIRAKCIDCCAGQPSEVALCTATACALWPYRMGSNPFSERRGNAANLRRGSGLGIQSNGGEQ